MNHTIRVTGALAGTALIAGALAATGPSASADDVSVAPVRTIKGPTNTELNRPLRMYVRGGNIHISNFTGGSVSVFAANANGDVPPMRHLAGAATGISSPRHVAADSAGFTWVANSMATAANRVLAFGPSADGNVAPDSKFDPGFVPFGSPSTRTARSTSPTTPTPSRFPAVCDRDTGRRAHDHQHEADQRAGPGRRPGKPAVGRERERRLRRRVLSRATGNATPARVIKGPKTQIQFATDVKRTRPVACTSPTTWPTTSRCSPPSDR